MRKVMDTDISRLLRAWTSTGQAFGEFITKAVQLSGGTLSRMDDGELAKAGEEYAAWVLARKRVA